MLGPILGAVALLVASALVSALLVRRDRAALAVGTGGALVACGIGLAASLAALASSAREAAQTPFSTALGPLYVGVDPLSAFFLACVFLVSGLAALYGQGYLRAYLGKRKLAPAVACFELLVASMAGVVLARDAVSFLFAWEVMSVSSFFLVVFESDLEQVRRAGMTYLVASHASVALLFVLFVLLARQTGRFDFASWLAAGAPAAALANVGFLLALGGFGAKAGFWPVHVWLPDAHPAAPSHVSAAMSGVMIKMGIYGLLRTLDLLGPPPSWWGGLLLGIGAVSGVLGVLHALAQHDLKRLLAYHSVENIGIISLGLGLGLLGRSQGNPVVAFLGFSGGLLHVLNHGLFKGLLFQGAGSVLHGTGTREIDRLGGLSRKMPHTAATFLVGAAAISGLPPLNGFISEWLIYIGAFRGAATFSSGGLVAAVFAIASLALIGGLAAACFVKAYGVVFLGAPRSEAAAHAHESPRPMTWAMWMGAGLCALVGLAPLQVVRLLAPAAASLAQLDTAPLEAIGPLAGIVRASAVLVGLLLALGLLRRALLRRAVVAAGPTWGCGYAQPSPRMQYTAASFADPVLAPFGVVFQRAEHAHAPNGAFPVDAAYEEHLDDRAERVLVPAVTGFARSLKALQFLQRGRVQLYLAYVLATLVVLLVWQAAAKGGP